MSPRFSVYVLSHNKNGWVQDAIKSVLDQDFTDFELWVIENSTDGITQEAVEEYLREVDDPRIKYTAVQVPEKVRRETYVPCWLLNIFYPQAKGEAIFYLSDDDLFMPGLFSAVNRALDDNPHWAAVYWHLARTWAKTPEQGNTWESRWAGIAADIPRGSGWVDCQIDACQIAYRTYVLHNIGQPYFDEGRQHANHADGVHLQKIAEQFTFQPIDHCGIIHRHTPLSTWSKG